MENIYDWSEWYINCLFPLCRKSMRKGNGCSEKKKQLIWQCQTVLSVQVRFIYI